VEKVHSTGVFGNPLDKDLILELDTQLAHWQQGSQVLKTWN